MTEPTIGERIEHRTKDEIHECARPGCGNRARVAFYVTGTMRLAGRDYAPGEFVDLCPDHDLELRRVAAEAADLDYGTSFDAQDMRILLGLWGDGNPLDRLREWLP